jgi:aminoglycoside N3'-acetyltransferase
MNVLPEIRDLGVRPGDLLMVHASMRALGLARSQGTENGAELLIDAIDEAVGPEGTWMMILGTHYAFDWVNQHPVEARATLLEGTAPLDFVSAPVLPEVGWLAEAFRRRSDTRISSNPSGRFAARGRRAEEILRDQPWNDYYGPGSPLEKLCAWGGRILRLGASPDTITALHFAEYLAELPEKRTTRWDYVLDTPEGPRHVWIDCLDDAEGIADWDGEDYFALITEAYLALGRHRAGKVGRATSELIDARDIVSFGARWMEEHFGSASRA